MKISDNPIKKSLRDIIVSEENVYNAIYCMESYVFEKGLLDENDLELYNALHDKFNFNIITNVIEECQQKLHAILSNNMELFDVQVYFKIKKFEKGETSQDDQIRYRPIHTAKLVDQICMVCMLLPLMFDDRSGKRKRSELTKMIPHDFYGNIPSESVEILFMPWINQYKQYTDNIIEHCKQYRKNHKYKTEITLDLKNFFPSISPYFIFEYITQKLQYVLTEEDKKTLEIVLTKLLVFKINARNLEGWESQYYGKEISKTISAYYSRGIAQGLPQSYFFGNLCMIEIRKKILAHDDFKQCDSFFYVDDSVIYIGQDYDLARFNKTIDDLNSAIKTIGADNNYHEIRQIIKSILGEGYVTFQEGLDTTIEFHPNGKSEFCRIEEAGMSIAGLEPLMRNASMAASIYSNVDEIEDIYSKDKLEKVSELIDAEILRLKSKISENKTVNQDSTVDTNYESRLKLIKRYNRFYLYRLRLLERRLSDEISKSDIEAFKQRFNISCFQGKCKFSECLNNIREAWFEKYDEEIFQTEARMFLSLLRLTDAERLKDCLVCFERNLVNGFCGNPDYLFFGKDFNAAYELKKLGCNTYYTISKRVKELISPVRSFSTIRQKNNFEKFVKDLQNKRSSIKTIVTNDKDKQFLPSFTNFVFKNSEEYVRIILNAYYSVQNDIDPSNAHTFTKTTSRGLHYTELRILSRLRNKNFCLDELIRALQDIDATNLDNKMSIDMGLLEVIHVFISKVKNPEWIDNIILTHRVVKGLWYNGSKFMNSYTLHNEEHAVTLIKAVVRLIKAIDYLNIKQVDYYILFLACYLHDVSMVIHPNINSFCNGDHESLAIISEFIVNAHNLFSNSSTEVSISETMSPEVKFKRVGQFMVSQFEAIYNYFSNNIRKTHPKESAKKIREWNTSVLKHLTPLLLTHVARVSESHGYDADEVYGRSSDAKDSLISEKYSMILIRLADLMDVANDRINYNLLRQNVSHMNPLSQFHWISHLITDEIQISPTFELDDKTDEQIENRKIIERLNFNLFVNVKFLESTKKGCDVCRLRSNLDSRIVTLPPEYSDCEGLMLAMFGDPEHSGKEDICPILCKWIVKKHEWFINELVSLNSYLNAVNDRWFKTEIRFNIIYRDDYQLDKDLYDAVCAFINP